MAKQQTVLSTLMQAQDKIHNAQKAYSAYKNNQSMPQFAKTQAELKTAVKEYIDLVSILIKDGSIKCDPSGILNGNSVFGSEIDEIASEFIISAENIESVIENAKNQGIFGKLCFYMKNGSAFFIDTSKNIITHIYGKMRKVFDFSKQKLAEFKQWLFSLFNKESQEIC